MLSASSAVIEFNVEQDPGFYNSLTYLPEEVAQAVIANLFLVAAAVVSLPTLANVDCSVNL